VPQVRRHWMVRQEWEPGGAIKFWAVLSDAPSPAMGWENAGIVKTKGDAPAIPPPAKLRYDDQNLPYHLESSER
jgi:hypothetical protein